MNRDKQASFRYDNDLLRVLRKRAGYKKVDIARKLGVHWSTVWRVEKGEAASLGVVQRMCDLYGVPVASVLGPARTVAV